MAKTVKSRVIAILLIVFACVGYTMHSHRTHKAADIEPSLLGVNEPPEMRVAPMPKPSLTPADRMLADAMNASDKRAEPKNISTVVAPILSRYPEYALGYFLRLGSLCESGNAAAILSDINQALKFSDKSEFTSESTAGLYSMRAKIEHDNGNNKSALDDLEKSIHADIADAKNFANSGSTEPEKKSGACTWNESDLIALTKHFPDDYRAFVAQGLYYSFFATFKPETSSVAVTAFDRAAKLNGRSALPIYFATQANKQAYSFRRLGMTSDKRGDLNRMIVQGMSKALELDPNLLPALSDRAEAYFELQRYTEAIGDYDHTLSINAKDAAAFNDRALAKTKIGDIYGAIKDFGEAISRKKRELLISSSYEGRADAYIETKQWDRAIADLDTAISLHIGGISLISSIEQFRAIYPEYKAASDEAIARKLRDTFYPNLKYDDFANGFLHKNAVKEFRSSTVIPDLYVKRADVHLRAGNWRKAFIDFKRAVNGFPNYADAIERWREIVNKGDEHTFIDMKTIDVSREDSIRLWIKQTQGPLDKNVPFSVQQFEVDCVSRKIRSVTFASYDADGNVIRTSEAGKWESIIPDSFAEILFNNIQHA